MARAMDHSSATAVGSTNTNEVCLSIRNMNAEKSRNFSVVIVHIKLFKNPMLTHIWHYVNLEAIRIQNFIEVSL